MTHGSKKENKIRGDLTKNIEAMRFVLDGSGSSSGV